MFGWGKRKSGFTIVELLIVIVVIGLLAAITIVAYSGIQARARDAQRRSAMDTIVRALELYKVQNNAYPLANSVNTIAGWEVSSINPSQFLAGLVSGGIISRVPVDPLNNGVSESDYLFKYYVYPAGNAGCDPARGDYYVLAMGKTESSSYLSGSPGFSCSGRDWAAGTGWVTGGYTK